MKKVIVLTLSIALFSIMASSCSSKPKSDEQVVETDQTKKEPAKKELLELSQKANSKMPMPMPGGIRLDKVEAVSKDEYKFYYTFTQAPVVTTEEFVRSSKLAITLGLQQAKGADIDLFKKHKMTLVYAYYNMDGKLFAEVKVAPNEYIK